MRGTDRIILEKKTHKCLQMRSKSVQALQSRHLLSARNLPIDLNNKTVPISTETVSQQKVLRNRQSVIGWRLDSYDHVRLSENLCNFFHSAYGIFDRATMYQSSGCKSSYEAFSFGHTKRKVATRKQKYRV